MSLHFRSLLPNATSFATNDFHGAGISNFLEDHTALVRFYSFVFRIALLLAILGQLKACTLELMARAAAKHEMMSYSKFTHALVGR